jgi:hypothetical protein
MKFIKVTNLSNKKPIYINIKEIGHFYRVDAKTKYAGILEAEHTIIGVTTHNNGGFMIIETLEEILELIKNSSDI